MKKYFYLLVLCCLLSFTAKPPKEEGVIFLSRDHGESWTQHDLGFPAEASVNAMLLSNKSVLVGTEDHGIYISDDELKSWHQSKKGLAKDIKIKALASHQNVLLAGSYRHGIYLSHDNGSSWEQSYTSLGNTSVRCFYSHQSVVFAGTDNAIFQSVDNGKNWRVVMVGPQINAFTSYHGILFAATSQGAVRSEDSGKTWSWVSVGRTIANIGVDGSDNLVSMTGDHRIFLGAQLGGYWLDLNFNFGQYTFRITPYSSPLLIAPWRNEFESLRSFRGRGLPAEVPFTRILATPYGVLVARSFGFC